jgi:hypothetical protein
MNLCMLNKTPASQVTSSPTHRELPTSPSPRASGPPHASSFCRDFSRVPTHAPRSLHLRAQSVQQLRDVLCEGIVPGTGPPRCSFSPLQAAQLTAAVAAAGAAVARARLAINGAGHDVAELVHRHFGTPAPEPAEMRSTIESISQALAHTPRACGTCFDSVCNERTERRVETPQAYVPEDLATIIICPIFFMSSPSQMRRTLIHEAGHAAGIDDQPVYSHARDCEESTGTRCDACSSIPGDRRRNVDVWSRFLDCLAFR